MIKSFETKPRKDKTMTKIANLAAAVVLVAPVAVVLLMQAAQIVA